MKAEHEQKVNELIPLATRIADTQLKRMGITNTEDFVSQELWNKLYHKAMDKLAFKRGLRVI